MKKIFLILTVVAALASCKSKTQTTSTSDSVTGIEWANTASLSDVQDKALDAGKPIFVDIGADWCGYCKKMKKNVFTNDLVSKAMNNGFVPVYLDGEKGDGAELVSKLGINGFPTQLILDYKGNVLKRNTGYLDTKQLLEFLK